MRFFTALFAVLLGCALGLSGLTSLAGAAAQEAAELGTAIPVSDEEGAAVGAITVNEVVDPFTEFNPDYPPEAGARYVTVNVAFDADAGQRFDISPSNIVLQDADGFLWNYATVYLPDDALVPELSSQTLAPGSRVTGIVGFVLAEGTEPARILYQPESSRFVVLADLLDQDVPGIGDTVTISDAEGGSGQVTVTDLTDPFAGFEPGYEPPDGTRYVQATLVYENPGEGRFFVEPSGLTLRDANGNLWSATSISRPAEEVLVPDLRSGQLAPGDRVSGAVVFAVPEGVDVAGLYTSPVSGQLLQLASLQAQETADDEGAAPAATPMAATDDATSASTVADACADVEQWLTVTRERIQRAGEMSVEDAALEDLTTLAEHVTEYAALAEAQLADVVPPEAEAANQALAETLQSYSGALEQILGADDPGKDVMLELTEGVNAFNDAGASIREIEDELARIASECGLS